MYDLKNCVWISWDKSKPRQGQWDMGHIEGHEYRNLYDQYINMKLAPGDFDENERRFLEEYRKASNYQPEDCHGNRSDNQKSKKRNCDSKK